MSDKKQPAQQRVNVRIVKADDPEQRGGMKPIAKADGSLQITPEEAYTAGVWAKPPFDLRGLSKMVDESTILPQCIRAYKSNIAGFGIDIRYKDDFADADETPEMKAEWDRATEVVEMLNMEQESNELFEDIVEARETYGCAYGTWTGMSFSLSSSRTPPAWKRAGGWTRASRRRISTGTTPRTA